jgi:hypothetical protein
MLDDWLFIGSSPNTREQLAYVREHYCDRHTITITTNSGIKLVPVPDFYLVSYQSVPASDSHIESGQFSQEFGTHFMALDQQRVKMSFADEFIDREGDPKKNQNILRYDSYKILKYSGEICMHYACLHGAKRLFLVGCEGYTRELSYFDEEERSEMCRPGQRDRLAIINRIELQPKTTMLCQFWADVEFICIGQPLYNISCKNWRVEKI